MRILGYEIKKVRKGTALQLHPEYKKFIEFAFEIDGVEYYQYKNLLDMPPLRWYKVEEFIREANLRIDSETLNGLTEDCIKACNSNPIKITEIVEIMNLIKAYTSLFMELDTFYRLFSAVFFTLDEDITVYDDDLNEEKIRLFKKQPQTAFFLQEPIKRLLPLQNISDGDIEIFSVQTDALKKSMQKIRSKNTKKE